MCTNTITFFKITCLIPCQRDDDDDVGDDDIQLILFRTCGVRLSSEEGFILQLRGVIHIVTDSITAALPSG